ncbi:UNVERIFIED_CONTAM: hypothetical protein GTU68_035922 [Idotea baltica]|nr:hypothetical protein [Idotea baltica]
MNIVGGNSKQFLGRSNDASTLHTNNHSGVVSYEPTELVVTVRAGTPMQALNDLLLSNGQMLPFEPPVLNSGTIGGVLACGLSGPARPFAGAARDYVLGMRVINGQAQALRFGGEVMKNVAGYDAARLHVGAHGTLGVLLETSMKVLPLPESTITVQHELANAFDVSSLVALMRQPLPISAAAVIDKALYIRLSGSESAVNAAAKICGGELVNNDTQFWTSIREREHAFFVNDQRPLWRISVPEFTDQLGIEGEWLYDWAGAMRYLKTDAAATQIYQAAKAASGHATCYTPTRMADDVPLFQPIEGAMQTIQKRVRDSFDEHRLFNPGRFHPELDTHNSTADH